MSDDHRVLSSHPDGDSSLTRAQRQYMGDRLELVERARAKYLSDFAIEERHAALGQRSSQDCGDDETIDTLLLDAVVRELGDVLQQMRKELAGNGAAVGGAQCVQDAAFDGVEQRQAPTAEHDASDSRPRSPVAYRTNGIP